MDSYRIEWKRSAIKELKYLPKEVVVRIVRAVGQLTENPFPLPESKSWSVLNVLIGYENALTASSIPLPLRLWSSK